MRLPRVSSLLIALLFLLTPIAADAATYYVATPAGGGSNSNPGTLAAPFATITYGLTKLVNPGDVLLVRGGRYVERVVIWNKHGLAGNLIWVGGYNGENPIIDGSTVPSGRSTVSINESSYVRFDGFVVENGPAAGINVWNAHNITVTYNTVRNMITNGIHAGSDIWGDTHDVVIRNNVVTNTVRSNIPQNNATTWMQAVSCFQANRVTFTDNYVYQNYGEGIDCIVSDNCTIARNKIWDNTGSNVYLDNAQYAVVDRNFIYHTGNSEYFRDGSASPGISVANESYTLQNPTTDLTITNNIVLYCDVGFVYWNSQYGGGMHNTLIANNVFYHSRNAQARLIYIEDGQNTNVHTNVTVDNNVFYQRSGVGYAWAPTVGFTWRTNNWYGGSANTHISGVADVLSNPLLVNAGGWAAADYKLTSGSPLIDAGTTETLVTTDHWGTTRAGRGLGRDIGAHEY